MDATQPGQISVGILGVSVSYNRGSELTSILLDGQELLGRQTRVSIGGRQHHELIVRCR